MVTTTVAPPLFTGGEAPEKRGGNKNMKRLIWATTCLTLAGLLAFALLAIGKETDMSTTLVGPAMIHGQVAPGFEPVEASFVRTSPSGETSAPP